MKTYELTYIITPEITSEEAEAKAKELESKIQSSDGLILKQTSPIAKTLAYPIKKRASGFFGVIELQAEPEKLKEIRETVSKNDKISRYIIIEKEPLKPRKEKRRKAKTTVEKEIRTENIIEKQHPTKATDAKEKVELKDIEEKLEEILG
jgi:small subunit ribosomal protein S6